MTEEQPGGAALTDEERRRLTKAGERRPDLERVLIGGIPFDATRQLFTAPRLLDAWYPNGKAPWTRVRCGIGGRWHDSGVEMRLERRDSGRWWIRVRYGEQYGEVWSVIAAEYEDLETASPNWWEIQCQGCRKPSRRDPLEFLSLVMFKALMEYRGRLTSDGRRPAGGWPPQIRWTGPTAPGSSTMR